MVVRKSTVLLQFSYNDQEREEIILIFTAEIDEHFNIGQVSPLIGLHSPVKSYNKKTSLLDKIYKENKTKNTLYFYRRGAISV